MASRGKFGKKTDIMNKKIPENPKYKHVKSSLDTGASMSKYMERIEDIRKNYRFRKDEIFKRIKSTTFAQLVLQVAEVVCLEREREDLLSASTITSESHLDELKSETDREGTNHEVPDSSRSTLQSVIRGMGEFEIQEQEKNDKIPQTGQDREIVPDANTLPYLLLDVRDRDSYDQCHIIGAHSYPTSMLSRSINYFTKEILEFIMNKKIPENPKYKHVKSSLDTGASMSKYMERIEDIRKNYRFRKDEIFKRIKSTTFAQLVLQVAEVVCLEREREDLLSASTITSESHLDELKSETDREGTNHEVPDSSRSTLQSVIRGMGEFEIQEQEKNDKIPQTGQDREIVPDANTLPYLLLDVRDRDSYDQCHIIGAHSYPTSMLSRSVNYFTKEILEFKNKNGKIIILYDEDERVAPNTATVFVQRDVDNVFLLSGGMKVLSKKFPGCLTTGTLPKTCLPTPPPTRKGKPKSKANNAHEPHEQRHIAWFTPAMSRLEEKLDDILLSEDSSRMSSRVSSRSTTSSVGKSSRVSNRTTASQASVRSTTSVQPWK